MLFAFRSQPLKTVYLLYFVASTLLVRLPFWIATSILPSARPRRSWSFGCAVFVQMLRAVIDMQFAVGLGSPPDPEKQAQTADALGFVWVEPVTDDLVVDDVAAAAKTNHVQPARISGYWLGKKDAAGRHGQRAAPGERVLYSLHGGGYVSGTAEPKSPLTVISTSIIAHSAGFIERAFALEYRISSAAPLAATNPFPAALIDALSGYNYLVNHLGFEPKNIIVQGDSAGGHLGLTLVLYLIRSKFPALPPPAGLLMLSPTLDWARTHDDDPASSMTRNNKSDYVHRYIDTGYTRRALLGSLPDSEIATNAYLSPSSLKLQLSRGFFSHFPPTCLVTGEAEITLDPMRTLRDRLISDNAPETITYLEYADAVHDWLFLNMFEAQKKDALDGIQRWIASVFGQTQ